jgi:hypothetical protein
MFTVNLSRKLKRLTFKIGVLFLASLFAVVLGPNLLELESSQALAKQKKGTRYCTQTATAAYKACLNEIQDDYNIAIGNCINVSDKEERAECDWDAKADRREALRECKDQREARQDVCKDLGEDRYDPELDPLDLEDPAFPPLTSGTANPYFPLVPGNTWIYHTTQEGEGIIETIKVEVLAETKEIYYPADSDTPFTCIVVRDRVWKGEQDVTVMDADDPSFLSDSLIEYTIDWYFQDGCGIVWYMGELARNYEDGELVDLEGSWKAGVDGAKPGILMWNYFLPDDSECEPPQKIYRQEFFLGDAEDIGEFVEWDGEMRDLMTKDYTPIEPDVFEIKTYRHGIGVISEVGYDDEGPTDEVVELVSGP